MPLYNPHKKTKKSSLQREVVKLRKDKVKAQKLKKQLLSRKKEIEEIKKLQKEVRALKGVGTKGRLAKEVATRMGKDAGKFSWKGLKVVGKFLKERLEAEAREQDKERARAKSKGKKKK